MAPRAAVDDSTFSLSLALLEPDASTRDRTARMLGDLGFQVHGCRDAASLFQWLDRQGADLVLVGAGAPFADMTETVLPRLSAGYGASILVQAPGAATEARLDALHAGAHLCLDRRYDGVELAALLRAQARRANLFRRRSMPSRQLPAAPGMVSLFGDADVAALIGPDAHRCSMADPVPYAGYPAAPAVEPARTVRAAQPWRVLYQGWVLIAPDGEHISLTGLERACFACLLDSPQRELSRENLSRFMSAANLRSVNVVISRLRKKVRAAGSRLPLHTVHRLGYVFAGSLVVEEAVV